MVDRESSRDIDRAASEWTARLDRAPLSAEAQALYQAWLKGDPRRRGAMLRAQSLSLMSESAQALGPRFDPAAFSPERRPFGGVSRRRAMAWSGGGIAAAALVAFGAGVSSAGAVTSTERGEIRLAPLKDGSTVLLNTDSSIRVRYDKGEREVTLLRGEAFFQVARDGRPFVVLVNGRRLQTTQAGFRVRKLNAEPVDVLVQWGRVDAARGVVLTANTQLALAGAALPRAVAPAAVTRDLAWREGKLAFEGETLKQAAEAFARYSATRIEIADPLLAREPVTGLFAANDPAGFGRAVARVFDARLDQKGDQIVLARGGVEPHQ